MYREVAIAMSRMLRMRDVLAMTGISRSTLWRKIRAGDFPAPFELGVNTVAFESDAVDAWLKSRPRRTYGDQSADGLPGAA
jgi:prophage regulatory protein